MTGAISELATAVVDLFNGNHALAQTPDQRDHP
jgi:hypothetical protein